MTEEVDSKSDDSIVLNHHFPQLIFTTDFHNNYIL